jgi:hypothetical protein
MMDSTKSQCLKCSIMKQEVRSTIRIADTIIVAMRAGMSLNWVCA